MTWRDAIRHGSAHDELVKQVLAEMTSEQFVEVATTGVLVTTSAQSRRIVTRDRRTRRYKEVWVSNPRETTTPAMAALTDDMLYIASARRLISVPYERLLWKPVSARDILVLDPEGRRDWDVQFRSGVTFGGYTLEACLRDRSAPTAFEVRRRTSTGRVRSVSAVVDQTDVRRDGEGVAYRDEPIANWREAENFVLGWLREHGCPDARLTADGSDGGVDVLSVAVAAQVKFQGKPVGRPSVQQIFGVATAVGVHPVVFACPGYTPKAIEWAVDRVALFAFDARGGVRAVNTQARQYL